MVTYTLYVSSNTHRPLLVLLCILHVLSLGTTPWVVEYLYQYATVANNFNLEDITVQKRFRINIAMADLSTVSYLCDKG